MAASETKTPAIDSLSRGIDLLEILARKDAVKLGDLPELLGTSRATAFRALKTLQSRGYVEHVPAQRAYRLGPAAMLLAARSRTSALIGAAAPAMRDIGERTGETINLAVFTAGTLSYVEIIEGRHPLRMSGDIGQSVPLHATALGKATLACLPEERQLELVGKGPYEAFAPNTHTTWKALQRDLRETARRGFAIDREEMDEGAVCVGAAIVGTSAEPLGGISASGFAARFDEKTRIEVGELLSEWCGRISKQVSSADGDGAVG
jgi:IclR family transcriptional regulator, acetate operon repressor